MQPRSHECTWVSNTFNRENTGQIEIYLYTCLWASLLKVWNYFVLLRITDEGSVREMRLWSILLIKSGLKWCIHLSRSLFVYFNYLVSVTAGGQVSPPPRGNMLPSSTFDLGWFVAFWKFFKIFHVKIDSNCNFVGLLHNPFWLQLVLALSSITSQLLKLLCLAKYHWRGFSTRNAHMVHIVN